MLWLN